MIRVTVELYPGGSSLKKKKLVVAQINNTLDSDKSPLLANYDVRLWNKRGKIYRTGRILAWPRLRNHVWLLVQAALDAALTGEEQDDDQR